jgi:mannonate dehydratase
MASEKKYGFEETWRWFGPNDPITLNEIKQTGATGIVTALHQVPVGDVWTVEDITKRKQLIEADGLTWSVVESVPVHENIKKRKGNCEELIANYKQSILNLGACGIKTVCYNFMPVLDWSRTDLNVQFRDGSITTKFEIKAFAAFDLFILKRKGAEKSYTREQIIESEEFYKSLNNNDIKRLTDTVLLGLPGSFETYTLDEFKTVLSEYDDIDESALQQNLFHFLKEVIPAAEQAGVFMTIHPDDPPLSLLGLPRIVGSIRNIKQLLETVDSPNNGLTLCTGSLGAGYKNDLVAITESFVDKINFVHLRNVNRNSNGDFLEENHLEGEIDIYGVMKALLIEQKKRTDEGRNNMRMPMRPDHGHLMLYDQKREGMYPGYSLIGRMKGLAELRGMEVGIKRSLGF